MSYERSILQYRQVYAKLLRCYPAPYYERFADSMEQTFGDLLKDRAQHKKRLSSYALWMLLETFTGIIKENIIFILMNKKNIIRIILVTVLILLIPLIGMQFENGFDWSLFDFILAGILLMGTGLVYEWISSRSSTATYRAATALGVGASLLLVWINLAVGFIGSEDNPLNTLYALVLMAGMIGAFISRLRPQGMANTLFIMAGIQVLIPVVALLLGRPDMGSTEAIMDIVRIFTLNTFFSLFFLGSGLLYKRSSEQ